MKKSLFIIGAILMLAFPSTVLADNIPDVADTTAYVTVTYDGSSAVVAISADMQDSITATISGADVTLTSNVVGTEVTYGLTGSTTDGTFVFVGTYKATVELFGVSITNADGPAIDIQNGKRIEVSAKKDTESTLVDGTSTATDAWKAAFQNKGHTEFKGHGTINVTGNYAHAIWSKEYIEVKNCTINVVSAVKDAINCNQYFLMESGELSLNGYGDDGIQVSLKNNDTSAENTGDFTMTGGTITFNSTSGSYIKAVGTTTCSGGTINYPTAIEEVKYSDESLQNGGATKVMENGQVYILRDNKKYTILGNERK